MSYFAQQLVNALQLGSIYALIALGYSLVYGMLKMINFAHGDVFMVGAFVCLLAASFLPLSFLPLLLIVMLATGLLGALIERVAYRPLRHAPRVSVIITALGCGLVLSNTMLSVSPYPRPMPLVFPSTIHHGFGLAVSGLQILIIGLAAVLMLALDWLIRRTAFGLAVQAISFDFKMVPLLGVPVNRIITLTFFLGGALAGAAGMLYGLAYPVIYASMGLLVGWKAFVAAVIGGIGNSRGAVLGGFILGATEILTVAALPSTYRDLVSYSLLLVILIFKPYGLLGRPPVQKV